ncbi:MAG: XRE family transcriptional regulator [Chloroflexi bacterium]|nr:XRE family transcriptional regulator [Chloroflexota bacterium]
MKLEQFLVKAKVSAYAGAGEGGEGILADGCKELTYKEGEFLYRDRYFGWNPFIGEEVVWQDNQVTWAMNYYGLVFEETVPAAQVYAFLQKAMKQVQVDRPFRGPQVLKEDDYEYQDESQGNLERFTGVERIFYRGREIYRLNYHGGTVKSKL